MNPPCATEGCLRPRRSANPRGPGGFLCPTCRTNQWRRDNPEKAHRRDILNTRNRNRAYRLWLSEVKVTAGCIDCGFNAHPEALDFDHRPGEIKCFIITLGYNKSRERVLAEMAKCDVRCANCHRIRTAERRGSRERYYIGEV